MYKQFYQCWEQEPKQPKIQLLQEKVHFLECEMDRIKRECYRLLEVQKLKNQKLEERIQEKELMIAYLRAQLDVLNKPPSVERYMGHHQIYPNFSTPKISHNFNISTEISPDSKEIPAKFVIGAIQKRISSAIDFSSIIQDFPVNHSDWDDSEGNSEMNETIILPRSNSNDQSNIAKSSSKPWMIQGPQQDEKIEDNKRDIRKSKGEKGKRKGKIIEDKGKTLNQMPIFNKRQRKSQSFQVNKPNQRPYDELKQKIIPQKLKKTAGLQPNSNPKNLPQKSTKNFRTNSMNLHKK